MAKDKEDKEKGGNKNGLKIIIIFLLLMIIAGGGAFAAYMMFSKPKAPAAATAAQTQSQTAAIQKPVSIAYCQLGSDSILVNLSDKAYLKVTIYFGYNSSNAALKSEVSKKTPALRDTVETILSSKSSQDFSTEGKEKVKKEILDKVNQQLQKGKLTGVYYYDFIIQQ